MKAEALVGFVSLLRSTSQETGGHSKRIISLIEAQLEHYDTVKVCLDKLSDFCEDVDGLKDILGPNVACLLRELMSIS